jgi:hypothetical protein
VELSVNDLMPTLIGKLDELETGIVGSIEQGQAEMICEMRQQPTKPSVVDLTQGPRRTPTGYGTAELSPSNNERRFFAVAKGRKTGAFTSWHKVLKLVRGYPGAVHKRFRQEEDAHEWLAQRIDPEDLTEDDDATFTTCVEPGRTYVPPDIGGDDRGGTARAGAAQTIETILDVTKIGSDTSIGNSKEICGTSIQVEPEVLRTLCPKGVIAPVHKELMDSTVDVTSLTGKYTASNSNTDGTIMMDQLAEAVGDLTELSARRVDESRTHRDTQWRLSAKNALDRIKTVEDLHHNAAEEISSMMGTVLSNMDACFLEILFRGSVGPLPMRTSGLPLVCCPV